MMNVHRQDQRNAEHRQEAADNGGLPWLALAGSKIMVKEGELLCDNHACRRQARHQEPARQPECEADHHLADQNADQIRKVGE